MGRKLPVTNKLPWDKTAIEQAIKTQDPVEIVDYLKKLIRTLSSQYEDVSNTVNKLADDIITGVSGDKPSASSDYRGIIYITESGAGVADTAEICLKGAADTYSWVTLATG